MFIHKQIWFMCLRPIIYYKILMEKPRRVGISSHTATSGKKSSFLPCMCMCSPEDIFSPLSHQLPLPEWQERCLPGARDGSTPRDAACSFGWGNGWAGLDTQFFLHSEISWYCCKSFLRNLWTFEYFYLSGKDWIIWTSPISAHPNFPKADVTGLQNLFPQRDLYLRYSSILHIC